VGSPAADDAGIGSRFGGDWKKNDHARRTRRDRNAARMSRF
jgi:hypothetical protein